MNNIEGKGQKIDIELDETVAEGTYSNLAVITHSSSEFVIDFVRMMPGIPKAKVKSRIIMNPEHAKRLMLALQDNIRKFESINGNIKVDAVPPIPMNFGGPKGQA